MPKPIYQRILLKLSGEVLMGSQGYGLDPNAIDAMADEIAGISRLGVEIGIVIGGGNIFRGMKASARGMDRVTADHMGMLATVINALAFQDSLEKKGIHCRVLTAITMNKIAEPFIRRRAMRHLDKGRVVIFAGGTGNPYFTTDTAASLRAAEIKAQVVLKGTKVDGIYDKDPIEFPDAKKFESISYLGVVDRGLGVIDSTAVTLCMEHQIPIRVFNFNVRGNLKRIILGEPIGTLITTEAA
jgi:uridylate kinase